MAKYTRRNILLNLTFVGVEDRPRKWPSTLVDRLLDFAFKRPFMAKGIKTLVFCFCWIRSIFARLNTIMDGGPMATIDKNEQPQGEIQVCDWCRMGLHKKCERHKLHTTCVCDCERGY